jgi:hypothetical protein
MSQPTFEGGLGASGRYVLGLVLTVALALGGMTLVAHTGAGKGPLFVALFGPVVLFGALSALLLPKATFVIEADALVVRTRSTLRPRPRERRIPWWDVVDAHFARGLRNDSSPQITVRRVGGETLLIVGHGSTDDVAAALAKFHAELAARIEQATRG